MRYTLWLLIVVTCILVIWELYTMCNSKQGDTISETVRYINRESGGLVALVYIILGIHWFLLDYLPTSWR